METIDEIAAAPGDNEDAAIAIAELALPVLERLPPGVSVGASTLLQRMGAKYHQIKALSRWLYAARFDGLLEGFWSTNEKRLHFGKATVDWHNKRHN